MDSLLLSRRDLEFMLYEWLDVCALTQSERYADHGRETFDAALDTSERIATELFAPHNQKADQHEPRFDGSTVTLIEEVKTAVQAFADAGLLASSQDYALGGMQLPAVVSMAGLSYFYAANVGTSAYPMLTMGNANLLLAHGNAAQIEAFVKPELEGRFLGTMCLSEPQAGSSLSDIATRAEYEGESPFGPQYRVTGNKMWISGGDHELSENIVHLVLVKIPDADGKLIPGVKGISLMLVPRFLVNEEGTRGERNDVQLAGVNHKMGYRGTVNCLLNFGEGTVHRPQGRSVGSAGKDAASTQVRIIEHADVKRMLLAQKSYVEGGLAFNLYCARLVDEARVSIDAQEQAELTLLLDILTPIAKSWPSQWCLAANDLAIQVHGGYGYTREYQVEQFYRDNRLNPIHEGTNGIQAIDLLGRKVMAQDGAAMKHLSSRMGSTVQQAAGSSDADTRAQSVLLAAALRRLIEVTQQMAGEAAIERRLANAHTYLLAFGHLVVAWQWLSQSLTAQSLTATADRDFAAGKKSACRYFFNCELSKLDGWLNLIAAGESSALDMQDAWF